MYILYISYTFRKLNVKFLLLKKASCIYINKKNCCSLRIASFENGCAELANFFKKCLESPNKIL